MLVVVSLAAIGVTLSNSENMWLQGIGAIGGGGAFLLLIGDKICVWFKRRRRERALKTPFTYIYEPTYGRRETVIALYASTATTQKIPLQLQATTHFFIERIRFQFEGSGIEPVISGLRDAGLVELAMVPGTYALKASRGAYLWHYTQPLLRTKGSYITPELEIKALGAFKGILHVWFNVIDVETYRPELTIPIVVS